MTRADRITPRRERIRAATIDEIKQTALRLMRESGTIDVRFTDIARAMDLTPPALYRYFTDRDALLNALITDAYTELRREIALARDNVPPDDLPNRWLAVAQAYRRWARREPQQFALIFGLPVPGYTAPEDGPTTEAARRAMAELSGLFLEARDQGRLDRPLLREVPPAMRVVVEAKYRHTGDEVHHIPAESFQMPVESFQAMLHAWAALHGFAALETYGHFDWLGAEAVDDLFLGQVRLAARTAGIPF
jgi:AcrR family transcriptional regulator